jgi:hypothetical protein
MLLGLLSLSKWRFNAGMLVLEGDRGVVHLFLTRRGFTAMTLGRAVLVVGTLDWATWVHELQHARQTERLGVFFPPAYLVQHMRFGYEGNPFEVEAVRVAAEFAADYPEKATEKYI